MAPPCTHTVGHKQPQDAAGWQTASRCQADFRCRAAHFTAAIGGADSCPVPAPQGAEAGGSKARHGSPKSVEVFYTCASH
jgi:hypothetical protein